MASLYIVVRESTERRLFILLVVAMVAANVAVLALAPRYAGSAGEGGDAMSADRSSGRDLLSKGGPDDPHDGLGPPDEVYEDVKGPEYPEDRE